MSLFPSRKIIKGCESDGSADSPFLTRWTLLSAFGYGIYLHRFHRSDQSAMHDHPWSFISIVLWNGYVEEAPCDLCDEAGEVLEDDWEFSQGTHWAECSLCHGTGRKRERIGVGRILRRPADWVHRVELVDGRKSLTLILRGPRNREWGFHTPNGWQGWKDYFKEHGC